MNIIEFIQHPTFLNDRTLSPAQTMALKAVYGLALTKAELEIFKQTTGLHEYHPGHEQVEATFILGRRSGKSDKLASTIALFEATMRDHRPSRGERPVVMIVASELARQSKIVFNYTLGKLEHSPALKPMIKRTTGTEIELRNGVSIEVYPANMARIRGASLAAFIGDECAFWKSAGISIDKEVLDSARPGLSFPHAKMIKISSPWAMKGEIWNDYKRYHGQPGAEVLVFQGSTELFNPAFSKKKLEKAQRQDPAAYATEYLAHFRADLAGMYDPEVIDKAVDPDRPQELPFRRNAGPYEAFVDVAGGGGKDSYAIAIGHLEDGRHIIDAIRSRRPKFNPAEVTREFTDLLKAYGIDRATGDKFSGDWASNEYAKNGIQYLRAEKPKSQLYIEAESKFNQGLVRLPNRDTAIAQLKALVRRTRSGGQDSVDTDGGAPEDEANVVGGLIFLLAQSEGRPGPVAFVLGHDIDLHGGDAGRFDDVDGFNMPRPLGPDPRIRQGPAPSFPRADRINYDRRR